MESDRVCMKSPLGLARHKLEEELKTEDNRLTVAWQKQNGFKEDLHDHRAVLQIIRRGIRIEGVKRDNKGAVWVLLAGRNKDATTYRFSEYYVKIGEQWVQRSPPLASDRPSLPKGWPPPIEDPQVLEKRLMLGMIERIRTPGLIERAPADGRSGARGRRRKKHCNRDNRASDGNPAQSRILAQNPARVATL